MDKVDQIIDSSNTEEEAISRIKKLAAEMHGKENVDYLIDTATDENDAITKMKQMARTAVPTLEDKYLGQVYEGFKKLGYAAKPITMLTTPITEAARAVPKYIAENVGENTSQTPPIDTGAEFKTLEPSDRAGTSLFMQDVNNAFGIKNQPLLNVESKEFPKAAQMVNNLSVPANAAGVAMDTLLAPKLPTPDLSEVSSAAGKMVPDVIKNNLSKEAMARKYLQAVSKDKGMYQKMQENGTIRDVENMIAANPEKYIYPGKKKVLDTLEGPIVSEYKTIDGNTKSFRDTEAGELGQLRAKQDEYLDQIPTDKYTVDRSQFSAEAKDLLGKKGLLKSQGSAASKLIDAELAVTTPDPSKVKKIKAVDDTWAHLDMNESLIERQTGDVLSQFQSQKDELVKKLQETPEYVENPQYRKDLQWLKSLEVIADPQGDNIFPKQRVESSTKITGPVPEYTPVEMTKGPLGEQRGFKQSGNVTADEGAPVSYVDSVDVTNPTADPLNTVKNQSMLDIATGKGGGISHLPNADYIKLVDRIADTERQISDVSKGVMSDPKNYNELARLTQERTKLEKFIRDNRDPSIPTMDHYNEHINSLNQEPVSYASKMRRMGNKLMSESSPFDNSTEVGVRQAAGSAIEETARNAQAQAEAFLPDDLINDYQATNKELSRKISLRDLTAQNRSTQSAGPNVPVGGMAQGTVRQIIDLADEHALPFAHRAADAIKRAGITYGTQGAKMAGVNLQAYLIPRNANEILQQQDLIADKINKELGPKAVQMFQQSLGNPQAVAMVLRQLEQANPGMFQADAYGRFDGEITNPILKQKAIEQIINNEPSAIEGAKKMQLLINGNKYYGG